MADLTSRSNITKKDALDFHKKKKPGKLSITPSKPLSTARDLSLAYSPGVAIPCLEIKKDPDSAYDYTAKGNMVAIMEVDTQKVSSYGIVKVTNNNNDIIEIKQMIEKPSIENAPSNLAIVGRYILDHKVFDILEKQERGASREIQLTDAISSQIGEIPCFGYKIQDERFDCGSKLGFLQANISYALYRNDLNYDLTNWLKTVI